MIAENAKKLLSFVNIKKNMDSIDTYARMRISQMHKQLEQATDIKDIQHAQGAIRELKRLTTLRDEVVADAEK